MFSLQLSAQKSSLSLCIQCPAVHICQLHPEMHPSGLGFCYKLHRAHCVPRYSLRPEILVKGLDANVDTIPAIFHNRPESLPLDNTLTLLHSHHEFSVPVIDLTGLATPS